jgi:hypothetical protein
MPTTITGQSERGGEYVAEKAAAMIAEDSRAMAAAPS